MAKYAGAVFLAAILTRPIVGYAECIVPSRPKPVRVVGRFCGQVFTRYEPGPLEYGGLVLYGPDNAVIAEVKADSKGRFRFPPLPKGVYRVGSSDGFYIMGGFGSVELAGGADTSCRTPVRVMLGLG